MPSMTKFLLNESDIPKQWYNVAADMPNPAPPPLNPADGQPIGPDALAPLFPMALIEQEVSQERWIDIPEEVRKIYQLWRPAPMFRAHRLEAAIGTKSKIYYKYEGVSPAGSHKLNTALPQAYYNREDGTKRIATETGAGQWGSAMSMACNFFGIDLTVYMVRISCTQKPYRKSLMSIYGAKIIPSPSDTTQAGKALIADDPNHPGSLGIAISEAVEIAATHDDTHYSLGSVLNHVCLHQTIIGLECRKQMELTGDTADIVIGCCGGGSNFAGLAFPFLYDRWEGKNKNVRAIAVEPTACPTLTRGKFAYDHGDAAKLIPWVKMYTLGHGFVPEGIHAGGLRYHGDSALVSQLVHDKEIEAEAYNQTDCFKAAIQFAQTEAIVPAPESSHAIASAIANAKKCDEEGVSKTILFNLSGHGHFDMSAYDDYLSGNMKDTPMSEEALAKSLADLPKVE